MNNPITEAFKSIKENKSRSILSSLGVIWGIFILIVLLGVGNGFKNGIFQLFNSFAKNSLWIYGGQVSETDLKKSVAEKPIVFDVNDINILKDRFKSIESISPELNYTGNSLTSYEQNITYPQIKGVLPDYFNVKIIKTDEGRLINMLDNKEYRRIAMIGRQVADVLFPKEKPIGKSINIAGIYFTIIGVIEKGSIFTQNEQNVIYIPYNTFYDCFGQGREFNTFILSLSKKTDASNFENEIKSYLGKLKGFSAKDKKALFILNFEDQVKAFDKLFTGINVFMWFIGSCLLLSGIVGISNIMFVIVKERTFEIGIRKAVGAKQKSIIWLILSESIVITSVAGILGLLLGFLVIQLINWVLSSFFTDKDSLFTSATVDFPVIIFCLIILIFSGVLSGFLPAKKAAKIDPIEALRQ
ncbi:ABC transporter permease [Flavobacterium piscis]|uniref:ABC transport system permease protein n=1 Tax=Flavobacterium piscis TaxID=1114874 RepID=A0ABU1Y8K8_9FLAO|nr:ABC transporter permease [Flavobacterium piscis]MDR7210561.1 putative ABC transport system permease protein [Flavobacterium piscis]